MNNDTSTDLDLETLEHEQAEGLSAALSVHAVAAFFSGAHIAQPLAYRVGGLEDAVAKLNKRAKKLGTEPLRLVHLGTVIMPHVPGEPVIVRAVVALYGYAPRAAGFSLVARVEHTEAGCIVARSPVGADDVDLRPYFDSKPVCAHCGFDRQRKDTFVVRNDYTGELKQIGRNCLADFIRSEDAERAVQMWKYLFEVTRAAGDDDGFGGGWSSYADDSVHRFVACAVSSIRREGFKKSDAGPNSTRADVEFLRNRRPSDYRAGLIWDEGQPTKADYDRASAVVAWCQTNELGAALPVKSDYLRSLHVAASLTCVGRHAGLLASAPVAYRRAIEETFAKKTPKPVRGAHVGEKGVRCDLGDLTVIRIRSIDNDWGGKTIVTAETADGSSITWFASGSRDFDAGTVLKNARGTVKKHDEFKGRPQTVVSRLAWKELVKPMEQAS